MVYVQGRSSCTHRQKIVKNEFNITGLYLSEVYLEKFLKRLYTRSELISSWLLIFFMKINLDYKNSSNHTYTSKICGYGH